MGGLLSGALVWRSTGAAFTDTTGNTGNQWHSGQVSITSAPGSALFALGGANLRPGDTADQCVTVTYTGNVLATIKLYQNAYTASGLAQYIQMTVLRRDGTGAADCSDWAGLANQSTVTTSSDLVWLSTNANTYATGLGAWTASTTTTKTYRFTYTLSSSAPNSAQSSTTGASYTWEAQA